MESFGKLHGRFGSSILDDTNNLGGSFSQRPENSVAGKDKPATPSKETKDPDLGLLPLRRLEA